MIDPAEEDDEPEESVVEDEEAPPEAAGSRTHEQLRSRRPYRGPRARTENNRHVSKRSLTEGRVHLDILNRDGIDLEAERPRTRGDCIGGARPCPWVSCVHNLYLDESDAGIKYNFPDREPEEIDPGKSCSLDVADYGGSTLEDVALVMNLTRERVRQIEVPALEKIKADGSILREFVPEGTLTAPKNRVSAGGSSFKAVDEAAVDAVNDDLIHDDDDAPIRLSFFADPDSERVDAFVTARIWTMLAKSHVPGEIAASLPTARAAVEQMNRMAPPPSWEALVTRTTQREATMAKVDEAELTDRQRTVLGVMREAEAKGEHLTAVEIADRAGIEGASTNSRGANASGCVQVLRRKGLLGATAPAAAVKPAAAPAAARPPKAPRERAPVEPASAAIVVRREPRPRATKEAPAAAPTSGLAWLIAEHEALVSRAAVLAAAIEALRPAS